MPIGDAIRQLREARGISQRELARQSGLKHGHISTLERGRYAIVDVHALLRICSALDITIDQLLTEAGLLPAEDPATALHLAELDRLFSTLSASRQEEVLAIIRAITTGPPE